MEDRFISEYFEADHQRLNDLYKQYEILKKVDYPRARENFIAFHFGLRRHMAWEEDVLFPLFEKKTGIFTGGPTDAMRIQHREIENRLDEIQKMIQAGNRNTEKAESELLLILEEHNYIEENTMYPAMDQLVTDIENVAAFEAIQKIPDERHLSAEP